MILAWQQLTNWKKNMNIRKCPAQWAAQPLQDRHEDRRRAESIDKRKQKHQGQFKRVAHVLINTFYDSELALLDPTLKSMRLLAYIFNLHFTRVNRYSKPKKPICQFDAAAVDVCCFCFFSCLFLFLKQLRSLHFIVIITKFQCIMCSALHVTFHWMNNEIVYRM